MNEQKKSDTEHSDFYMSDGAMAMFLALALHGNGPDQHCMASSRHVNSDVIADYINKKALESDLKDIVLVGNGMYYSVVPKYQSMIEELLPPDADMWT